MTDTNLSPAAQAVIAAVIAESPLLQERGITTGKSRFTAAALRAAADMVTPFAEVKPQENLESHREAMVWGMNQQTQLTRQQLLAIAHELDSNND